MIKLDEMGSELRSALNRDDNAIFAQSHGDLLIRAVQQLGRRYITSMRIDYGVEVDELCQGRAIRTFEKFLIATSDIDSDVLRLISREGE